MIDYDDDDDVGEDICSVQVHGMSCHHIGSYKVSNTVSALCLGLCIKRLRKLDFKLDKCAEVNRGNRVHVTLAQQ